jgi:NhaA family Na+:H+ antiporter
MFILASGVHAAITGVILALTVTSKSRFDLEEFDREATTLLRDFKQAVRDGETSKADSLLGQLETLTIHTDRPIDRVTRNVLPWVALVILPLFALANSGVTLTASSVVSSIHSRIFWGIATGLVVGKPLGIALFSWLAARLRLAQFPEGATMRDIIGLGTLAGIGFTVAIFISNLAFPDEADLEAAKVAILGASCVAGLAGYSLLRLSAKAVPVPQPETVQS